jgi:hypothetical protein
MDNTWWLWGQVAGLLCGHSQVLPEQVVGGVTLDSWTKGAECQWWADLVTNGGLLVHPKFLPLMETAMAIGRFLAQGVQVRLQGSLAQLSQEKDPSTSGGRLPCHHLAMVLQSLPTSWIQEMDREGGNSPLPDPPAQQYKYIPVCTCMYHIKVQSCMLDTYRGTDSVVAP